MTHHKQLKSSIDWQSTIEKTLDRTQDKNSHVEIDPTTFHPSQISKCKRQCYISKLGLKEHSNETLGNFITGTLIHEWLEKNVNLDNLTFEVNVEFEDAGITWVGHTDCYDVENNILYDFKTTGAHSCSKDNFYYLDEDGNDSHIDQLTIYMRSLMVPHGKIVNICKKNPTHVQEWPQEDLFSFDWERYRTLLRKAQSIESVIREQGQPDDYYDIPFDQCGCWLCEKEQPKQFNF